MKLAFIMRFSAPEKVIDRLTEDLILNGEVTTGTILKIKEGNETSIHYKYIDRNQTEIVASFDTKSFILMNTGDKVKVIYNENFSALL